jgi:hypothetical protein
MKKVTLPASQEESVYYSDFSGKCFGDFGAPIELTLEFNYGSKYDGALFKLHLDDEDVSEIMKLIKSKLSDDAKEQFLKKSQDSVNAYEEACSERDWVTCECIFGSISLYEHLSNNI